MNKVQFFPAILLAVLAPALAACGSGIPSDEQAAAQRPYELDLPRGLEDLEPQIPEDNPLTVGKVALGKKLYFDKRLSADGTVACATCHNPRLGFTDAAPVSTGVDGQTGGRSAPTVVNRVFSTAQFWDGRAESLEAQAIGPIANPIEMGFSHDGVVERLQNIDSYREEFETVFGTQDFTIDQVAKAIASYERTIVSGNSPYDRYVAGEEDAMGPAAQRGMALFFGEARCAQCHSGPNFADEQYHNIGIGMDEENPDLGRYAVTEQEEDKGAFKTPTLRDVALTAPYFHDGSVSTLEEVIEYYDRGGVDNDHLSPLMQSLGLTEREKADLVRFLENLTGEVPLESLAPQLPAGQTAAE